MTVSTQTITRNLAKMLMREARNAGWVRAKVEVKPDGCVTIEAAMLDVDATDDFLGDTDLRMTK